MQLLVMDVMQLHVRNKRVVNGINIHLAIGKRNNWKNEIKFSITRITSSIDNKKIMDNMPTNLHFNKIRFFQSRIFIFQSHFKYCKVHTRG